ncbi:hypothetical protein [Tabrizicola sp.]|uniref:hypothetical protein n=1 Tax=Tabrizicola sp. TaxID=2005166 RepID=UPI00286D4CCE|nr:hypothetical protein [Tabrizicola sp.]
MTSRKPDPTPIQTFLAPVATLALKQPEIEALVFWGDAQGWDEAPTEALESEEIAFYAEGLLEEGFHMVWTVVALQDTPALPDHIRLHFWQDGAPPPGLPGGWLPLARAEWAGR